MSGLSDSEFDRLLDEHQQREREAAEQSEREGDHRAVRPQALREEIAFADLHIGDFITAEDGPYARWVEVVAVAAGPELKIAFATPRPLGLGRHERFVMRRRPDARVVVDAAARGERHWRGQRSRHRLSPLAAGQPSPLAEGPGPIVSP